MSTNSLKRYWLLILLILTISIVSFLVYSNYKPPSGTSIPKGSDSNDVVISQVALITSIVSLITGIVALVRTVLELKSKK